MDKLIKRAEEVYDEILEMRNPLVIHHYDCDGLTSGSIVIKNLRDKRINFQSMCVKKVDERLIKELKDKKYKNIIFVDLGASSAVVDELKENVIIIDHHQVVAKEHLQINPHLFGFNGGRELSASGTAYFVFKNMEDIALVGAVGDMQYPLTGLNRAILKEGEKKNIIKTTTDITLYGKSSRPLPYMLSYSDDPVIPMITGNEKEAINFLLDANIPLKKDGKWLTYYDLPKEMRQRLVGRLIEYLAMWGMDGSDIIGEVYTLPNWPKNTPYYIAQEFATVLNACGRNEKYDIGIRVCLRDEEAFPYAEKLLRIHKKNLREGVNYAKKNTIEFTNFYYLDGRGIIPDSIIGVVIGMLFSMKRKKPYLGIANYSEEEIKISTRALKIHNVNLGSILSKVCGEVGGIGGGHELAAGATIPKEKLNDFLLRFNDEISKTVRFVDE